MSTLTNASYFALRCLNGFTMSPPAAFILTILTVVAVILPILISFIFGGQASLYASPPYGFDDIPDLTGRVAIVTGSNTGIGYVTARELARKGAKVIIAARSEQKGKDTILRIKAELHNLPGADLLEFIKLDLANFAAVRKFARDFSYERLKLDILILNAAVWTPSFGLTVDGLETHIGTNHFGHFLLVKLLLPIIKVSKTRIVHVSSNLHGYSYPEGIRLSSFTDDIHFSAFTSYGQSKLANVLFSNELARQLNGTGVTSNSVHPGVIKTDLLRNLEFSMRSNFVLNHIADIANVIFDVMTLDVDGGALTQLFVATSPSVSTLTGEYFVPIGLMRSASNHGTNSTLGLALWEESERLTRPYW